MTSKEKLLQLRRDFYSNNSLDYDSISYFTSIEKDLEVLEILKSKLSVEKGSTWFYLEVKHPFFETQEEINKIKEWLENDK